MKAKIYYHQIGGKAENVKNKFDMMNFCYGFIIFLLVGCNEANLSKREERKDRNKQYFDSILITALLVNERNNLVGSFPISSMTFRYSVQGSQVKTLSIGEYCVNVFLPVNIATDKVVTEWQGLTRSECKCEFKATSSFYQCLESKLLYLNQYLLKTDLGFSAANNICKAEIGGILVLN